MAKKQNKAIAAVKYGTNYAVATAEVLGFGVAMDIRNVFVSWIKSTKNLFTKSFKKVKKSIVSFYRRFFPKKAWWSTLYRRIFPKKAWYRRLGK